MKKTIEGRDIILSAASGILIALSFPKFGLFPLAWIGLAPLLIILKDKYKKRPSGSAGSPALFFSDYYKLGNNHNA